MPVWLRFSVDYCSTWLNMGQVASQRQSYSIHKITYFTAAQTCSDVFFGLLTDQRHQLLIGINNECLSNKETLLRQVRNLSSCLGLLH